MFNMLYLLLHINIKTNIQQNSFTISSFDCLGAKLITEPQNCSYQIWHEPKKNLLTEAIKSFLILWIAENSLESSVFN